MIRAALVAGALVTTAATATATAATTRGRVETASARWTRTGDLIVTDVVVQAIDGTRMTVVEPGGTVDGLGMWISHRERGLAPGDDVAIIGIGASARLQRISPAGVSRAVPRAADGPRFAVQRTSRSGRAIYHPSGCLTFQYDAAGTSSLPGDAEWDAFDAAFDAWEEAAAASDCGGVRVTRQRVADAPEGRDGINTIHFRDDTWCRPASGIDPELCHSPDAVAVTRVLFVDDPRSPRDGEILEVDMDVNTVDFTLATDGAASSIDLESTAAHEIGHAFGLEHNCGVEDGAWPVDDDGNPVTACESASAEQLAATMYVQVAPGTVAMRSPEASDVAGLCEVVAEQCVIETTGGCQSAPVDGGSGSRPLLAFGLVGLLWAIVRRSGSARPRASCHTS